MSQKNHKMINGRLLQMNKPFSQLKQKQKEKIQEWLYQEYARIDEIGKPPNFKHNIEILSAVYDKIESAEIWIPFHEAEKYFYSRKRRFQTRYEKAHNTEKDQSIFIFAGLFLLDFFLSEAIYPCSVLPFDTPAFLFLL